MFERVAIGITALALAAPAYASHVPVALDTPDLWKPLTGAGYLEFIEIVGGPIALPLAVPLLPPGFIDTEEHTGFVDLPLATGVAVRDPVADPVPPYLPCTTGHDCDMYAGDRADFDYVQEHHADEVGGAGLSNHPFAIGMLGFTIGTTVASPHFTGAPGVGAHAHSVAEAVPGGFPELALPDFQGVQIGSVDVFSITSVGVEDSDATARDAALDYELWFVNSSTGASTPGTPIQVFVPGWTPLTTADDYIARWVPTTSGQWDTVALDPIRGAPHDRVIEIDAVVAATASLVLPALGTPGLAILMALLAACALLLLRRPALAGCRS